MHPYQRQIDLCNRALDAVRPALPVEAVRDVSGYINDFDECGLGMEFLMDHLAELDVKITLDQFALILEALESMGMGDSDRLAYLREHGVLGLRPSSPGDGSE